MYTIDGFRRCPCHLVVILATVLLVLLPASPAEAQTPKDVASARLLEDFLREQELRQPNSLGAISLMTAVMLEYDSYRVAVIDSLADGLELLANGSQTPIARLTAISMIGMLGEAERSHPRAGTVTRLIRVYGSTKDYAVRWSVVRALSRQAESEAAAAFLARLAMEPPSRDEQYDEPMSVHAVRALARMGEAGRRFLQELERTRAVVHPAAQSEVSIAAGAQNTHGCETYFADTDSSFVNAFIRPLYSASHEVWRTEAGVASVPSTTIPEPIEAAPACRDIVQIAVVAMQNRNGWSLELHNGFTAGVLHAGPYYIVVTDATPPAGVIPLTSMYKAMYLDAVTLGWVAEYGFVGL